MEEEEVLPSDLDIKETIGKKGLMWPSVPGLNHPAMKLDVVCRKRLPC